MPTFASYDGTLLAYHEKGAGPPLICVPGGPGRASAYLGDLGGLSRHRRLILLDNRGTGDSAVPTDPETYRCDRIVADLDALRAHLRLPRMDMLAHSAAGNVATLYAARHPDRLAHLVLVAPSWHAAGVEFEDSEWLAALRRRRGEPWYEEAFAAMMRLDRGEWSAELRRAASPLWAGYWTEAAKAAADSDAAQRSPLATEGFAAPGAFGDPAQTRAALCELTAPVLLVGGELDAAPTVRVLTDFAALFPRGRVVVVPHGGHSPWMDDPLAFGTAVTDFLGTA